MDTQTVGSEEGPAGSLENGMSMLLGPRLRGGQGGRGQGRADQEAGPGVRIGHNLKANKLFTEESCALSVDCMPAAATRTFLTSPARHYTKGLQKQGSNG